MQPFKEVFEKSFNENMHADEDRPGRASPEVVDAEMDLKKGGPTPQLRNGEDDLHNEKKHPPRFSTLFGTIPPPRVATPPAVREYQREYYPRAQRKSGVFMPMPLFIVFAVILFFESTILFAYTVIGLYNNAPSRLFPWAGPGAAAICNYQDKQPGINFAPSFNLGQPAQLSPLAMSGPVEPDQLPAATTSSTPSPPSTTSTSTSSTTTTTTTSEASTTTSFLSSLTPSTTASTPAAPVRPTVTAMLYLTVDPEGNPITSVSRSTTVIYTVVTATPVTSSTVKRDTDPDASVSSALAANSQNTPSTTQPAPTTTLLTSTTPAPTPEPTTTTATATWKHGGVCFGGSGAVELDCV